jgi:hypothetical protein
LICQSGSISDANFIQMLKQVQHDKHAS